MKRYVGLVARERELVEAILTLAEQLRSGTIETVLAKSDLELGLEAGGRCRPPVRAQEQAQKGMPYCPDHVREVSEDDLARRGMLT